MFDLFLAMLQTFRGPCVSILRTVHEWLGSVAEWLACWTQAQKGLGSNRSRDAVG